MDLKIAAIAIAKQALLLTRNTKDFGQIQNLAIEDWTIWGDQFASPMCSIAFSARVWGVQVFLCEFL
jgi:hypothetical protein